MDLISGKNHIKPLYRLGPFFTHHLKRNVKITRVKVDSLKIYKKIFSNYIVNVVEDGRSAIYYALNDMNLETSDEVFILTTSQGSYVSRCVTETIEKFCNWNMKITNKTKAILVIHEFGYCAKISKDLLELNLPIIEDYAYSFFSAKNNVNIKDRYTGNYIIFSLPKIFPVRFGGILLSKRNMEIPDNYQKKKVTERLVTHYGKKKKKIVKMRRRNYSYLLKIFTAEGCKEYKAYNSSEVPGVFMFYPEKDINLDKMKEYFQSGGVESSILYGQGAYFIPCHQCLEKEDMDYFLYLYKSFSRKKNENPKY